MVTSRGPSRSASRPIGAAAAIPATPAIVSATPACATLSSTARVRNSAQLAYQAPLPSALTSVPAASGRRIGGRGSTGIIQCYLNCECTIHRLLKHRCRTARGHGRTRPVARGPREPGPLRRAHAARARPGDGVRAGHDARRLAHGAGEPPAPAARARPRRGAPQRPPCGLRTRRTGSPRALLRAQRAAPRAARPAPVGRRRHVLRPPRRASRRGAVRRARRAWRDRAGLQPASGWGRGPRRRSPASASGCRTRAAG